MIPCVCVCVCVCVARDIHKLLMRAVFEIVYSLCGPPVLSGGLTSLSLSLSLSLSSFDNSNM